MSTVTGSAQRHANILNCELRYKNKMDWNSDVILMFDNCETFNEDESPVGRAGHSLRSFFDKRWADLFDKSAC